MARWDGRHMPRPAVPGRQVVDAMTAYQLVHILEGVILRGTARSLRSLERPLFGKTGTNTGPTNVWFVGGTPDTVIGVYLGFDRQRSMGGYAQGGTVAAPVFRQFVEESLSDRPVTPFRAPSGIRMVRIDRRSGRRVYAGWPQSDAEGAVIWEAFRPESEPTRTISRDEMASRRPVRRPRREPARVAREQVSADTEFLQSEGGIY
jgi:penicillin-binding protein 1A